jgi:hypothetical protein
MILGPKCAMPENRVIGWPWESALSRSSHSPLRVVFLTVTSISSPFLTSCDTMLRKTAKKPKHTAAHAMIPPTKRQTGTKESPILLLSDDDREEKEDTRRPLATTQKTYLGVSPSDPYTFKGHGSAYDIMIAMGYKPNRGLGPNLRGSATFRSVPGVSFPCLFSVRERPSIAD